MEALIGALLGFTVAAGLELLRDVLSAKRRRQERDAERSTELQRERAARQRQTLEEMQEFIFQLNRASGHIAFPTLEKLRGQESQAADYEELFAIAQTISIHSVRIEDDDLRTSLVTLRNAATSLAIDKRPELMEPVGDLLATVNEKIGELLRGRY